MKIKIKGKNFTVEEEAQLCVSWLEVSQAIASGRGDKFEVFWEQLRLHYEAHKPAGTDARSVRSLDSKWSVIHQEVTMFIALLDVIAREAANGVSMSEEHRVALALERYEQNHAQHKPFAFLHCWRVLKEVPNWQALRHAQQAPGKARKKRQLIATSTPSAIPIVMVDLGAETGIAEHGEAATTDGSQDKQLRENTNTDLCRNNKRTKIESTELISAEPQTKGDSVAANTPQQPTSTSNEAIRHESISPGIEMESIVTDTIILGLPSSKALHAQSASSKALAIQHLTRAIMHKAKVLQNTADLAFFTAFPDENKVQDEETRLYVKLRRAEILQSLKERIHEANEEEILHQGSTFGSNASVDTFAEGNENRNSTQP